MKRSDFRLEHSLGATEEATTTTESATTTTKQFEGETTVYVVAVNERQFYREHFESLWKKIHDLVSASDENCAIQRTSHVESCSLECSMTSDPERGCVAFSLGFTESTACSYNFEKFKMDLEDK